MASKDLTLLESVYNEMYQEEAPTVRDLGTEAEQVSARTQTLHSTVSNADLNDPAVTSQLQAELADIMRVFGELYNKVVDSHGGSGQGADRVIAGLHGTHGHLKKIKEILLQGAFRESVHASEFLLTINEAINFASSSLKLLL